MAEMKFLNFPQSKWRFSDIFFKPKTTIFLLLPKKLLKIKLLYIKWTKEGKKPKLMYHKSEMSLARVELGLQYAGLNKFEKAFVNLISAFPSAKRKFPDFFQPKALIIPAI